MADRDPYVFVTWLTPLLSKEKACEFMPWYRARNKVRKTDGAPDDVIAEHDAAVERLAARLESDGYEVFVEDDNWIRVDGKTVTLGAKPDVIGHKDGGSLIADAKTGRRRGSDRAQVLIYMYIESINQPTRTPIEGLLDYTDGEEDIPASDLNDEFRGELFELLRIVGSETPPAATPSAGECNWCPLTVQMCPARIEPARVATDDF